MVVPSGLSAIPCKLLPKFRNAAPLCDPRNCPGIAGCDVSGTVRARIIQSLSNVGISKQLICTVRETPQPLQSSEMLQELSGNGQKRGFGADSTQLRDNSPSRMPKRALLNCHS